jgi:hypothetical protein
LILLTGGTIVGCPLGGHLDASRPENPSPSGFQLGRMTSRRVIRLLFSLDPTFVTALLHEQQIAGALAIKN